MYVMHLGKEHIAQKCLSQGTRSLKVRSHQTRIARMIYMLSHCKDAIEAIRHLFARMRRRELRKLRSAN